MRARWLTVVGSSLALTALAACGGGEGNAADEEVAERSLLAAKDLPAQVTTARELPEGPCDPQPVLIAAGAPIAETPLYELNGVRVKEAVGVFLEGQAAAKAFDSLNSRSRRECIRGLIGQFSSRPVSSIEAARARGMAAGDEAKLMSFRVPPQEGSGPPGHLDVVSIRSGRSVAALLFLTETGSPEATVRAVSGTAADLLARASTSR